MVHIKKVVNNVTSSSRKNSSMSASTTIADHNSIVLPVPNPNEIPLLARPSGNLSTDSTIPSSNSKINRAVGEDQTSTRTKRALSGIFRSSSSPSVRPSGNKAGISIPNCPNVSRGILLAIIFVFLFASVIIWFAFNDTDDDDDKQRLPSTKFTRISTTTSYLLLANMTDSNQTRTDSVGGEAATASTFFMRNQRLLIFLTTVSIVTAIVIFVFVSAIIQYFRNPVRVQLDWSPNASLRKNLFTSIFSYNRNLTNLYYIDQSIAREELVKKRNRELGITSDTQSPRTSFSSSVPAQQSMPGPSGLHTDKRPPLTVPIIIVDEVQ